MNILFINTIDSIGGAALVGWNLGKKLTEQGHTVKYIVGFKKSQAQNVYQLRKFFILDRLTARTNIDFNFIFRGLITKFLANDIDYGAENEILNHPWYKQADIIHCNNLHGNFFKLETLAKMSKEKKIVWTLHDEWAIMSSGSCVLDDCNFSQGLYNRSKLDSYPAMIWNNQRYLGKKKRAIYSKSNFALAVPSMWLFDLVKASILKKKKIKLIFNGIDVNIFRPYDKLKAREELGLPANKRIITFIADSGRKNSWKGWAYIEKMIDYFKYDDNILFLCIGGSTKNTRNAKPNIRYIDYTKDSRQLAKYYSSSNLLLFPSIVESFGLVAVEAMSCGIPVVAFPVGVIPELVDHKQNGYIAKLKDLNDLIDGVLCTLALERKKSPVISSQLSKKVRTNFSLEIMTEKYLRLYQELLANNG